jgi:hypothetical protein
MQPWYFLATEEPTSHFKARPLFLGPLVGCVRWSLMSATIYSSCGYRQGRAKKGGSGRWEIPAEREPGGRRARGKAAGKQGGIWHIHIHIQGGCGKKQETSPTAGCFFYQRCGCPSPISERGGGLSLLSASGWMPAVYIIAGGYCRRASFCR